MILHEPTCHYNDLIVSLLAETIGNATAHRRRVKTLRLQNCPGSYFDVRRRNETHGKSHAPDYLRDSFRKQVTEAVGSVDARMQRRYENLAIGWHNLFGSRAIAGCLK